MYAGGSFYWSKETSSVFERHKNMALGAEGEGQGAAEQREQSKGQQIRGQQSKGHTGGNSKILIYNNN